MPLFGPPNVEKMKAKGDVKGLIKALGYDKDWKVRRDAAEALGWIGARLEDAALRARAVEPLVAAVKHEDRDMCLAAIYALGRIGDAHALEPLVVALRDKDKDVRIAAARALGWIGARLEDAALRARAVEPLIAALKDWYARQDAARALGEIGDACAVEPLIAALKGKNKDLRLAAASALGQIGVRLEDAALRARAVEPLITSLRYVKDKDVRIAAAEALGQIGDARAVKPLIAALKDRNVRRAAARALGEIGAPAVEPLIAALKGKDKGSRLDAIYALGHTGDDRAAEPLIAVLKDEDHDMRRAAIGALNRIGDPAVEPLTAVLKDDYWLVRRAAVSALGQIGDDRTVEPLLAALQDENFSVRERAAEALVTVYKSGRLGSKNKRAILTRKNDIKQLGKCTHTDSGSCTIPHKDYGRKGFHVDF